VPFGQSYHATSAASTALSHAVNPSHQSIKTSVGAFVYDGSSSMLAISRGLSLSQLCAVILHVIDPRITGDKDDVQYPPSRYAFPWSLVDEHQILLERRLMAFSCFTKSCITSHTRPYTRCPFRLSWACSTLKVASTCKLHLQFEFRPTTQDNPALINPPACEVSLISTLCSFPGPRGFKCNYDAVEACEKQV
jgi:hypothetical protein